MRLLTITQMIYGLCRQLDILPMAKGRGFTAHSVIAKYCYNIIAKYCQQT